MSVPLFPLFLRLEGRVCVVVGGDATVESKIRDLIACGARIRLIAPSVNDAIAKLAATGQLQWVRREYRDGDLDDAMFVIAAANASTNARVSTEAEKVRVFCNAVDDVPHCSCFAAAVVRRGPLQVAISTNGQSPALAQRLRKEFEQSISSEYGTWVEQLGEQRRAALADTQMEAEEKKALLHQQASASAFESYRNSSKT